MKRDLCNEILICAVILNLRGGVERDMVVIHLEFGMWV